MASRRILQRLAGCERRLTLAKWVPVFKAEMEGFMSALSSWLQC